MLFLFLLGVLLTACGSDSESTQSLSDLLPLAKDKPTFIFFYTDG